MLLFYLIPKSGVGDGTEKASLQITDNLAGFHFAAHKHTDVGHECITDGERRGGA